MKMTNLLAIFMLGFVNSALPAPLRMAAAQNLTISAAIVTFQDDTGENVPADLTQKLAHDLHQAIAIRYRDLLPRLVGGPPPSATGLSPDQVVALAKQNGAKYIVRGGL